MSWRDDPSMGDYAWAAAQDAQRKNESLEARVAKLEADLARLQKAVSKHLIDSGDDGE